MIDEALDQITHDMAYAGYDEQLVSGIDQVAQNVKIRLLLVMGELFDNTTLGVDYFGTIFSGNSKQSVIDSMLKSTIKGTPEVSDILDFSSSFDRSNRSMTVSFTIDTTYGKVTMNNIGLLS